MRPLIERAEIERQRNCQSTEWARTELVRLQRDTKCLQSNYIRAVLPCRLVWKFKRNDSVLFQNWSYTLQNKLKIDDEHFVRFNVSYTTCCISTDGRNFQIHLYLLMAKFSILGSKFCPLCLCDLGYVLLMDDLFRKRKRFLLASGSEKLWPRGPHLLRQVPDDTGSRILSKSGRLIKSLTSS